MKGRGLYNQFEGNEHRTNTASFQERLDDNEVIEGQEVQMLRSMIKSRRWDAMNKHIDKLRSQGWSQSRIDSLISRATNGMRF